jgi:hypothetical protein
MFNITLEPATRQRQSVGFVPHDMTENDMTQEEIEELFAEVNAEEFDAMYAVESALQSDEFPTHDETNTPW